MLKSGQLYFAFGTLKMDHRTGNSSRTTAFGHLAAQRLDNRNAQVSKLIIRTVPLTTDHHISPAGFEERSFLSRAAFKSTAFSHCGTGKRLLTDTL
jgi:hypothetical protein